MARNPRFNLPGIPQHVIQRGNNREPCFCAELDYRLNLDILSNHEDLALIIAQLSTKFTISTNCSLADLYIYQAND